MVIPSRSSFPGIDGVKGDFMRKISLALVAVATLVGFGVPVAEAGVTCKVVPAWCPADGSSHQDFNKGQQQPAAFNKSTSVPEPGALALLVSGVSAVGGFALRRKRMKKD